MGDTITWLQATVLAFIQGITEFLPVSSSGHLALVPLVSTWPDQGLAFDCVVHLGTLSAVMYYFRSDLRNMGIGWGQTVAQRSWQASRDGQMAWLILLATIPAGIIGLTLKDYIESDLRSIEVIGWASIGFGLLLWLADRTGTKKRGDKDWRLNDALMVGLLQALALIPGTSRSGITMTGALLLGFTREAAARFSFLLSIPVIFLAGGLKVIDWIEAPNQAAGLGALVIGFIVSAISAYICIHYFLKFLNQIGMGPFVIYRCILGAILLWMVW